MTNQLSAEEQKKPNERDPRLAVDLEIARELARAVRIVPDRKEPETYERIVLPPLQRIITRYRVEIAAEVRREVDALQGALSVLMDSTAWETIDAWYPAMDPEERRAVDYVRNNLRALATRRSQEGE